jgi:hypothetical protein
MRKYLEFTNSPFTSEHQEKAKYENRPYVGYSSESGLLYTQP